MIVRSLVAFQLLLAVLAPDLGAQSSATESGSQVPPKLEQPIPPVVQRGVRTTVRMAGARLARAERVVFANGAGMSAKILDASDTGLEVSLEVASDAAAGLRELRVIASSGASNAVLLRVCDSPVTAETEPNDDLRSASALRVPSRTYGSIHAATELDHFVFEVERGQRISFDLHAHRIGSSLDPALTVVDTQGRAVAWGTSTHDRDAILQFTAPRTGEFILVLRDVRYRGGEAFHYELQADSSEASASVTDPRAGAHELEPDDSHPRTVSIPVDLRGSIDHKKDRDVYGFRVTSGTKLRIEASALPSSALDPLIILQDANGKHLKTDDDGGGGVDARIDYSFGPGEYRVVVRSLVNDGSRTHTYRLRIAPPEKPRPDFTIRIRPDTPVVRRGSHSKLWCEVVRRGGFEGDLELAFEDLPAGVTAHRVVLNKANGWTSVFTVSATLDAELGSRPLHVEATSEVAGRTVRRRAIPESGSEDRRVAWLSVLEPGPFTVAPLGAVRDDVHSRWAADREDLVARLKSPSPALAREIEKATRAIVTAHRGEEAWISTRVASPSSKAGNRFEARSDGSVVLGPALPDKDTYIFTTTVDIDAVGAVRLDVLPDPALPSGGPGLAKNGNFVIHRFAIAIESEDAKSPSTNVPLVQPAALFSQRGYDVAFAVDDDPRTGWAMSPKSGTANWAIFDTAKPIPRGTRLVITLDQQHGSRHVVGRFRVSFAKTRLQAAAPVVPEPIHRILEVPADSRSQEDADEIHDWIEARVPAASTLRKRIAEIDAGRGNDHEIRHLEARLDADTAETRAAQRAWENGAAKSLVRWEALEFHELRSEKGIRFLREPKGVVRAVRPVADKDNYSLIARTRLRTITALRLETLPTKELAAGGAGLASSGNFVLTDIRARVWPAEDPSAVVSLRLHDPAASFEQSGFSIRDSLDAKSGTGWAVYPKVADPHFGLWKTRRPGSLESEVVIRIDLQHHSQYARHQLGRFRFSVTSDPNPRLLENGLPVEVARGLTTPRRQRTKQQRQGLRRRFREVSAEFRAIRDRIRLLRVQQATFPPTVARNRRGSLAIQVDRDRDFDGPVRLSLEGFSTGREKNREPKSFTADFEAEPILIEPGQTTGVLEFKARPKCDLGTRAVVVRAEGQRNGETIVEYSPAIPFTVIEPPHP